MSSRHIISKTVECSRDVRVRLNVDPPGDVLLIRYLPDDELLTEVLVVDNVRCVADHMFDLKRKVKRIGSISNCHIDEVTN